MSSITDIIGDDSDYKFHTIDDIITFNNEWMWLEPPFVACSMITGEIKDTRKFEKRKIKQK